MLDSGLVYRPNSLEFAGRRSRMGPRGSGFGQLTYWFCSTRLSKTAIRATTSGITTKKLNRKPMRRCLSCFGQQLDEMTACFLFRVLIIFISLEEHGKKERWLHRDEKFSTARITCCWLIRWCRPDRVTTTTVVRGTMGCWISRTFRDLKIRLERWLSGDKSDPQCMDWRSIELPGHLVDIQNSLHMVLVGSLVLSRPRYNHHNSSRCNGLLDLQDIQRPKDKIREVTIRW